MHVAPRATSLTSVRGRHLLEEHLPDGSPAGAKYNATDPNKGPRPHVLRPAQPGRLRGLAVPTGRPVLALAAGSGPAHPVPRDVDVRTTAGARTKSWSRDGIEWRPLCWGMTAVR
jgi:hypothetical protein